MPDLRKFYYLPSVSDKNREPDLTNSFNWKFQGTWHPPALFQYVQIDPERGVKVPVINYDDLSEEERDKQIRFKKILGILNKITLDNYKKLILLLGLDSMDSSYIKMLAEIIFSKALDDDMYIHLYSKLCEEIIVQLSPESCEVFKCVLRDLCNQGFESTLQTRDSDIKNIDGRKQLMFKRILMSIIRFTTELSFINNPLYDRSHCIDLIKKLIDTGELLHLEAVYFIWTTSAMRYSDFTWPDSLSSTIDKLAEGVGANGEAITPRVRFMFLSLVDSKNGILKPFQFVPYQDSLKASDLESIEQVPNFENDYRRKCTRRRKHSNLIGLNENGSSTHKLSEREIQVKKLQAKKVNWRENCNDYNFKINPKMTLMVATKQIEPGPSSVSGLTRLPPSNKIIDQTGPNKDGSSTQKLCENELQVKKQENWRDDYNFQINTKIALVVANTKQIQIQPSFRSGFTMLPSSNDTVETISDDYTLQRLIVPVGREITKLSKVELLDITKCIRNIIREIRSDSFIPCLYAQSVKHRLIVTAKDQASLKWLLFEIHRIRPWEGVELVLKQIPPKLSNVFIEIHSKVLCPILNSKNIFIKLERFNQGLSTRWWWDVVRWMDGEFLNLIIRMDQESLTFLEGVGFLLKASDKDKVVRAIVLDNQPKYFLS